MMMLPSRTVPSWAQTYGHQCSASLPTCPCDHCCRIHWPVAAASPTLHAPASIGAGYRAWVGVPSNEHLACSIHSSKYSGVKLDKGNSCSRLLILSQACCTGIQRYKLYAALCNNVSLVGLSPPLYRMPLATGPVFAAALSPTEKRPPGRWPLVEVYVHAS